jgi:hypothetical protein
MMALTSTLRLTPHTADLPRMQPTYPACSRLTPHAADLPRMAYTRLYAYSSALTKAYFAQGLYIVIVLS